MQQSLPVTVALGRITTSPDLGFQISHIILSYLIFLEGVITPGLLYANETRISDTMSYRPCPCVQCPSMPSHEDPASRLGEAQGH